jgi:hypothetical protein
LYIPYGATTVTLHGILFELNHGDIVQMCQLQEEDLNMNEGDSGMEIVSVTSEIDQLLL